MPAKVNAASICDRRPQQETRLTDAGINDDYLDSYLFGNCIFRKPSCTHRFFLQHLKKMLQEFSNFLQHEFCNIFESAKILGTLTLQHFPCFSKSLQHFFATISNVAKTRSSSSQRGGLVEWAVVGGGGAG